MAIDHAAKVLKQGGIVAYPTEAVFGLGCDPQNERAVLGLLEIKQRPIEKGLILIASSVEQLGAYIEPETLQKFPDVLNSWPGPHTWLLPFKSETPSCLTGEHKTIAVRVTAHAIASELCKHFGNAIVSTSANKSDDPPAKSIDEVRQAFGNSLDYILEGAIGEQDSVTTIRDAQSGNLIR